MSMLLVSVFSFVSLPFFGSCSFFSFDKKFTPKYHKNKNRCIFIIYFPFFSFLLVFFGSSSSCCGFFHFCCIIRWCCVCGCGCCCCCCVVAVIVGRAVLRTRRRLPGHWRAVEAQQRLAPAVGVNHGRHVEHKRIPVRGLELLQRVGLLLGALQTREDTHLVRQGDVHALLETAVQLHVARGDVALLDGVGLAQRLDSVDLLLPLVHERLEEGPDEVNVPRADPLFHAVAPLIPLVAAVVIELGVVPRQAARRRHVGVEVGVELRPRRRHRVVLAAATHRREDIGVPHGVVDIVRDPLVEGTLLCHADGCLRPVVLERRAELTHAQVETVRLPRLWVRELPHRAAQQRLELVVLRREHIVVHDCQALLGVDAVGLGAVLTDKQLEDALAAACVHLLERARHHVLDILDHATVRTTILRRVVLGHDVRLRDPTRELFARGVLVGVHVLEPPALVVHVLLPRVRAVGLERVEVILRRRRPATDAAVHEACVAIVLPAVAGPEAIVRAVPALLLATRERLALVNELALLLGVVLEQVRAVLTVAEQLHHVTLLLAEPNGVVVLLPADHEQRADRVWVLHEAVLLELLAHAHLHTVHGQVEQVVVLDQRERAQRGAVQRARREPRFPLRRAAHGIALLVPGAVGVVELRVVILVRRAGHDVAQTLAVTRRLALVLHVIHGAAVLQVRREDLEGTTICDVLGVLDFGGVDAATCSSSGSTRRRLGCTAAQCQHSAQHIF
eukprot:PhM_4_TR18888/c2_g1_i1/m.76656